MSIDKYQPSIIWEGKDSSTEKPWLEENRDARLTIQDWARRVVDLLALSQNSRMEEAQRQTERDLVEWERQQAEAQRQTKIN